jgi:uncharacterized repeat protein (TIGR03803 family)
MSLFHAPENARERYKVLRLMMRGSTQYLAMRLSTALVVSLSLTLVAFAQSNEQILYSLQGGTDGSIPEGRIVFDSDGNLYGATNEGGASQCGMVYQLSPPLIFGSPWTETAIYSFRCKANGDAAYPLGGLAIDDAGNLYGTTAYGGAGNCLLSGALMGCGTIFELSPPPKQGGEWTESIIYSFPTDAKEGYVPWGDLVFDSKGNLYGATQFGGGHGTYCNGYYVYCGAVYELSPPSQQGDPWTERVLHGFSGVTPAEVMGDGANPNGDLILDSAGNVYGTTFFGGFTVGLCKKPKGSLGCGTVFELSPPGAPGGDWTEAILHRFDCKDGDNPAASVTADEEGNLYGTTYGGPGPYGMAFRLNKPTNSQQVWTETALYLFGANNNGWNPGAGLTFDSIGRLYGTAIGTYPPYHGEIYRLAETNPNGSFDIDVFYDFAGSTNGGNPYGPLIFDQAGNIYGITQAGGTGTACLGGCGTIYEISP